MFLALCEAIEKLEIVEGRDDDDYLLLSAAIGTLLEVKEELRDLSF